MSNLKRVCVIGSNELNNYYLIYSYLNRYLPMQATILTGTARGVDQLATCYAQLNAHPYQVYEANWNRFGQAASMMRDLEMISHSDHLIAFWNGKSTATRQLIDEWNKQRSSKAVVVDIRPQDRIYPHPNRVVHVQTAPYDVYVGPTQGDLVGILGNPYHTKVSSDRFIAIAKFTDYFLKSPELINQLLTLKSRKSKVDGGLIKFGCWCAPEFCHADVLCWLLDHAYSDLCSLAKRGYNLYSPIFVGSENKWKNTQGIQGFSSPNWRQTGDRVLLCTATGLPLARGYDQVISDAWGKRYLEVNEPDLFHDNIHLTLGEQQASTEAEEPELTQLMFYANDHTNVELIHPLMASEHSRFRPGYWYISVGEPLLVR